MSFDPYQCVERRWGATDPRELATCPDGATKRAWYAAEQNLRNQIDRTYEAEMDFTLDELGRPVRARALPRRPTSTCAAYLVPIAAQRNKTGSRAAACPVSCSGAYSAVTHYFRAYSAHEMGDLAPFGIVA